MHVMVWRVGRRAGDSVVSCTSRDSPVASLPLSTSRICALFGVRTGSFSKGYIAEGKGTSCWADASEGRNAGNSTAGSIEHNSRRVTDMVFSLKAPDPQGAVGVEVLETQGQSQEETRFDVRAKVLSALRIRLKSQLHSEFHGSVPVCASNGACDVAKTNGVARVCGWLTELRGVGYAECPWRIFSRSVNLDGQK